MATDNNIKNFTAADIEKYHKGSLSSKQMHDLEKAALDDPFLADALEGYAVAGVNSVADIAELKKRLAEKTEDTKVIPLNKDRQRAFPLLRVAAMIVILAGAALLVYQFAFNHNSPENSIAKNEPLKKEEVRAADSSTVANIVVPVTVKDKTAIPAKPGEAKDKKIVTTLTSGESTGGNAIEPDKVVANIVPGTVTTNPVATESPKGVDDKSGFYKATEKNRDKKEIVREEIRNKTTNPNNQEADKDGIRDEEVKQQELVSKKSNPVAANRKTEDQYRNTINNTFRGRVTDASNVGVPFANVTNTEDNVGTYTDSKGYFNLTSPDTVLNVQVRSIGFENNNVQLKNKVPSNQVVLQDDRKSLSEVVISKQKPNATARSHDANMKLEEPEPADGWENYDTYLTNNLNVPDEFKAKPTKQAEVEISFEVDKNGDPVNIKVEKSLCDKCDKEAIRLIKEGPKWKRKARKGRTTVTVPFHNSF